MPFPEHNHKDVIQRRDSELWDELYEKRDVCERSFKREKKVYKLAIIRTRGEKMWFIRVALGCMCQHIDAQAEVLLSFTEEEKFVE